MEKKIKFTTGEALRFGWQTFGKNALLLIAVTLIIGTLSGGFSALTTKMSEVDPNSALSIPVNLLSIVINIIIAIGLTKIALDLVYKRKTELSLIFTQWKYFWRYLGASILYGLIVIGGLILLIVPGVIWGIKYSYFSYAIVDKDMGVVEALRESGKITMGYKGQLFWFKIVLFLVQILGVIALGVGYLVAYPITVLAEAWVYRRLAR